MSWMFRAIATVILACSLAVVSLAQGDVGVVVNSEQAMDGYTFIAPQFNHQAYVIDNQGRVINEWDFGVQTREIHLLENGNVMVLRGPYEELDKSLISLGYAVEGAVAEYTWEGEMVWEYVFRDPAKRQHHGINILPSGNILAIVWDYHRIDEAMGMGLDPAIVTASFGDTDHILPDTILEIDRGSKEIVWQWEVWDHLIQNLDDTLPNYGEPADNPQRIDINYHFHYVKGYEENEPEDWIHANSVFFDPRLKQIALSLHRFDEFWIIDRDITSDEAKGPAGDLLYRWGNPAAFGQGDLVEDRRLFRQHDVQWIAEGLPGAGNVLLYNNRNNVLSDDEPSDDEYSSILEVKLPLLDDGSYDWNADVEVVWEYDEGFYSRIISGVQRLPNGNTFITAGVPGRLIEVSAAGEVVWEFVNSLPVDARTWIFRARKYPSDHPGFADKDLAPGRLLGE